MRAGAALLLLLAACGGDPGGGNAGISTNQIERLSTPKVETATDAQLQARPQPLTRADIQGAGMARPTCDFRNDGHVLLAATPSDALARVNGRLYHFSHSSPVGPTGGAFEDRQLGISVGRIAETGAETGRTGRWPARMRVTNRRAGAQVDVEGVWRCGS